MRSRLAIALLLSASAPRICAAAGVSAEASSLAEQRYREGRASLEGGDFEGARLAFVQAYALDAEPRYLCSLAQAEAKGGHPLEALAHFRQYLRLPAVTEDERRAASSFVADVSAKTGHIRVETVAGATITLDSTTEVGTTPLVDPIDVAPGPHRLRATKGAQSATATIAPGAGETVVWQLQWESPPGPGAAGGSGPPLAPSPAPEEGLTPNGKPLPTTKWIVAAGLVGGGLLSFGVAGAFTGAASNEATKEFQLSAQTGVCLQPPTTAACAALKNAADVHATYGNVAIGFIAGGGALAAAGVVALVAWPTLKPAKARGFFAPVVTASGGGAQWVQPF